MRFIAFVNENASANTISDESKPTTAEDALSMALGTSSKPQCGVLHDPYWSFRADARRCTSGCLPRLHLSRIRNA